MEWPPSIPIKDTNRFEANTDLISAEDNACKNIILDKITVSKEQPADQAHLGRELQQELVNNVDLFHGRPHSVATHPIAIYKYRPELRTDQSCIHAKHESSER
jgi:hypothetical protein